MFLSFIVLFFSLPPLTLAVHDNSTVDLSIISPFPNLYVISAPEDHDDMSGVEKPWCHYPTVGEHQVIAVTTMDMLVQAVHPGLDIFSVRTYIDTVESYLSFFGWHSHKVLKSELVPVAEHLSQVLQAVQEYLSSDIREFGKGNVRRVLVQPKGVEYHWMTQYTQNILVMTLESEVIDYMANGSLFGYEEENACTASQYYCLIGDFSMIYNPYPNLATFCQYSSFYQGPGKITVRRGSKADDERYNPSMIIEATSGFSRAFTSQGDVHQCKAANGDSLLVTNEGPVISLPQETFESISKVPFLTRSKRDIKVHGGSGAQRLYRYQHMEGEIQKLIGEEGSSLLSVMRTVSSGGNEHTRSICMIREIIMKLLRPVDKDRVDLYLQAATGDPDATGDVTEDDRIIMYRKTPLSIGNNPKAWWCNGSLVIHGYTSSGIGKNYHVGVLYSGHTVVKEVLLEKCDYEPPLWYYLPLLDGQYYQVITGETLNSQSYFALALHYDGYHFGGRGSAPLYHQDHHKTYTQVEAKDLKKIGWRTWTVGSLILVALIIIIGGLSWGIVKHKFLAFRMMRNLPMIASPDQLRAFRK